MPIVSPGGIVTPADSDGWDLTTDLATMATSIDSAVSAANAGANAFKGTASDRGLFTSTATNGMLWQDTDGMKMIWRKDGALWVPAVWRWSGTASQMNAFSAPNGFEWFSTTDNSDYVRLGGSWVVANATLRTVNSVSQSLPPAANVQLNLGTVEQNQGYTLTTNSFQVPATGTYSVTASTLRGNTGGTALLFISPAGSIDPNTTELADYVTGLTSYWLLRATGLMQFTAGVPYCVVGRSTVASTTVGVANAPYLTRLHVFRVS